MVILFATGVYLIDGYVYSWIGWLAYQAGSCESKLIKPSAAGKDGFKKLHYSADLTELASHLQPNPNYAINSTENSLIISRIFDKFEYKIVFETRTVANEKAVYYQYSIKCRDCEATKGEKCITPDFEIYQKCHQIITDLPLGHRTEMEILSGLKIYHYNSTTSVFE